MSFPADTKPVILTPQSKTLTDEEAVLYEQGKPFGFILFGKHCGSPEQVQNLCADLRDAVGWHCPILIDQEGGRVARMVEPHWHRLYPAKSFGDLYRRNFDMGAEAVMLQYRAIAKMLGHDGVDVNCAPCLDCVPAGATADAIGDRCFSHEAREVAALGKHACLGMIENGVTPVIKHMPGHGRAVEDSHYHLPVVMADERELVEDMKPFKYLSENLTDGTFWGMTAHVVYKIWDDKNPTTLSEKVIKNIIRERIGFKGLLLSDDLAMKALADYGSMTVRALKCLDAGVDIALPCHTTLDEGKDLLDRLPDINSKTQIRLDKWLDCKRSLHEGDSLGALLERLEKILPKKERRGEKGAA